MTSLIVFLIDGKTSIKMSANFTDPERLKEYCRLIQREGIFYRSPDGTRTSFFPGSAILKIEAVY